MGYLLDMQEWRAPHASSLAVFLLPLQDIANISKRNSEYLSTHHATLSDAMDDALGMGGTPQEEICDNGIDDDGDGLIDGLDPDCAGDRVP